MYDALWAWLQENGGRSQLHWYIKKSVFHGWFCDLWLFELTWRTFLSLRCGRVFGIPPMSSAVYEYHRKLSLCVWTRLSAKEQTVYRWEAPVSYICWVKYQTNDQNRSGKPTLLRWSPSRLFAWTIYHWILDLYASQNDLFLLTLMPPEL